MALKSQWADPLSAWRPSHRGARPDRGVRDRALPWRPEHWLFPAIRSPTGYSRTPTLVLFQSAGRANRGVRV